VIENQGRLRTAVQGPDGNLYLVTDADPGKILRVVPS
jgi:glucose/arabinose dehydrogenase